MKWQRVVRIEVRRKGFVCEDEGDDEVPRRVVEWARKEGRRATQSVLGEGKRGETRRGQLRRFLTGVEHFIGELSWVSDSPREKPSK